MDVLLYSNPVVSLGCSIFSSPCPFPLSIQSLQPHPITVRVIVSFAQSRNCLEGLRESNLFQEHSIPNYGSCFFLHQCYTGERIWFFSLHIIGNRSLAKLCPISRIGSLSKVVFSSPSIKGPLIGALLLIGYLINVYYS